LKSVITIARNLFALLTVARVLWPNDWVSAAEEKAVTRLQIQGTQFALNGRPTFLLGISYYGGLGASEESLNRDLEDFQRNGFRWIRVWATWAAYGTNVSALGSDGEPREPFLARLRHLVAACDRRGLVVDVTLTRGSESSSGGCVRSFAAHKRAIETVVKAIRSHANWFLDLANERDVGDARYVSPAELKALRERVRELDPQRLVTASFGGHDLSDQDIEEAVNEIGLDFLSPHRPRSADSPGQTEEETRAALRKAKAMGRAVPVLYQEPFRRGYSSWQPKAADFLADLRGAVAGGAAGWCFHNGGERIPGGGDKHRSFDLHRQRLVPQLDTEEMEVLSKAAALCRTQEAPHSSPHPELDGSVPLRYK
jgi:hypothetical protein